jgi:hypothetical protein
MFCAFEGAPKILRLYGKGTTVVPDSPTWADLAVQFELLPGTRQIIVADIERVQTSCGFGVPLYQTVGQRDGLITWAEKKGTEGLSEYQRKNNLMSIDGLAATLAKDAP